MMITHQFEFLFLAVTVISSSLFMLYITGNLIITVWSVRLNYYFFNLFMCMYFMLISALTVIDSKELEVRKLKADIEQLGVTAAQALELGEKVQTLEAEVKTLNKESVKLTEAYNAERVRNIVELLSSK